MNDNALHKNRLLMEMERTMRSLNRNVINPDIPELTLNDLEPAMKMVASVRSAYLKAVLDLGKETRGGVPEHEQVVELRKVRECYEELVLGSQALETAIKRGYLDVGTDKAA